MPGFTRQETPSGVVFEVQPEPLPKGWSTKPFAIAGFVVGFASADGIWKLFFGPLVAVFFAAMASVFGGGFMHRLPAARQYRSPARFTVSADAIEVAGRRIPLRDIQRVMVRNHMTGDEQTITVTVRNTPTPIGVAVGQIHRARLNAISYRVDVESMGVPQVLAGGLTEATASGLAMEVVKAAGMR